jgi:hypothetical protein
MRYLRNAESGDFRTPDIGVDPQSTSNIWGTNLIPLAAPQPAQH